MAIKPLPKNNSEKYNKHNFTYPIDLFDEEYGGNLTMFYINVVEDSKLEATSGYSYVETDNVRERGALVGKNINGQDFQDSVQIGSALGVVADNLGVASETGLATSTGPASGEVARGLVAEIFPPSTNRSNKRLDTAIALHMPNKLNIKYATQWQDASTLLLSAASEIDLGWTELKNLVNNSLIDSKTEGRDDAIRNSAKEVLNRTGNATGALSASILYNGEFGKQISVATGSSLNPKKEQFFDGPKFRDFSLTYKFFARSQKEAQNINNIIYLFKYHMHPEISDNQFLWTYPSEFDIEYIQDGADNTLHRHTSCVLLDMSVDYTPDGVYQSLPGGEPPRIDLTLNFRELALLDKKKIRDGGY